MRFSAQIAKRLREQGVDFKANDNIADHLQPDDIKAIRAEVAVVVEDLLDALVIDRENDHNTQDTARRVAKMFVDEVFAGRYLPQPKATAFPNVKQVNGITTVGPITVRSACSHHLVPILGKAWVGVIPGEKVIGLSKFSRLAEWVLSRPQIQEEATEQVADLLEQHTQPKALAVVVKAQHMCCSWRGVRDAQTMGTSVMRGLFFDHPEARAEFMKLIEE